MIDCIYLCGGQGSRAKLGGPKQYATLNGAPMFLYGLTKLLETDGVGNIIIVADDRKTMGNHLDAWLYGEDRDRVLIVTGGARRQDSVRNGLQEVETRRVLVMESARPLVSAELINRVMEAKGNIVTPWMPCKSSVLHKGAEFIDRDKVGEIQLPQAFQTDTLRYCFKHIELCRFNATYSDDTQMVYALFGELPHTVVPGEETNIKVTTPDDFIIAETLLKRRNPSNEEI